MLVAGLSSSMAVIISAVLLMNFATAVQDIAVDGLVLDATDPSMLGWMNTVQIIGFKVRVGACVR